MSSNSLGIPAGRLAQYAMLVASVPGLERRGSKAPYTSLNGNKSSFLTDTGCLALRLDPDGRHAIMRDHQAKLCERHGRVMKEYVAVPEAMWKQRTALRRAFVSSVAYVGALKPKVSKRKKTVVAKPKVVEAEAEAREPVSVMSRTTVARKPAKKATAAKSAGTPAKTASAKAPKRNGASKASTGGSSASKSAARKSTTRKTTATKTASRKTTSTKAASRKAAPEKAATKKAASGNRKTTRRKVAAA